MSDNLPQRNQPRPGPETRVNHDGRDAFWAERHGSGTEPTVRRARKKWQCLACGECGFVEFAYGENPRTVAQRLGHRCQPESIAFYTAGAHRPLRD